MSESRFAKTANRSVVGVMNRLEFELNFVRDRLGPDLQDLSLWMSDHLVGALRGSDFRTPLEKLLEAVRSSA